MPPLSPRHHQSLLLMAGPACQSPSFKGIWGTHSLQVWCVFLFLECPPFNGQEPDPSCVPRLPTFSKTAQENGYVLSGCVYMGFINPSPLLRSGTAFQKMLQNIPPMPAPYFTGAPMMSRKDTSNLGFVIVSVGGGCAHNCLSSLCYFAFQKPRYLQKHRCSLMANLQKRNETCPFETVCISIEIVSMWCLLTGT